MAPEGKFEIIIIIYLNTFTDKLIQIIFAFYILTSSSSDSRISNNLL